MIQKAHAILIHAKMVAHARITITTRVHILHVIVRMAIRDRLVQYVLRILFFILFFFYNAWKISTLSVFSFKKNKQSALCFGHLSKWRLMFKLR